MMTLEEWLDIMIMAENMVKVRRRGFVKVNMEKWAMAEMMAANIGVDLGEHFNAYYDPERFA